MRAATYIGERPEAKLHVVINSWMLSYVIYLVREKGKAPRITESERNLDGLTS
jgi:hypothetical protein